MSQLVRRRVGNMRWERDEMRWDEANLWSLVDVNNMQAPARQSSEDASRPLESFFRKQGLLGRDQSKAGRLQCLGKGV